MAAPKNKAKEEKKESKDAKKGDKKKANNNINYKKRWEDFIETIGIDAPSSKNENIILNEEDYEDQYKILQNDMTNSYPMLHGSMLTLMQNFIKIKAKDGSKVEQAFYSKNCKTIMDLADRIATKRAVKFYASMDDYLLRNGKEGQEEWELVGTDKEGENNYGNTSLVLKNYMSYDEISLSSMCGISSPTTFINNGDRYNKGRETKDKETITSRGVYMGLIGSRFERDNVMEKTYMVITKDQNSTSMGFGSKGLKNKPVLAAFAEYYGITNFPEYSQFAKMYKVLKKKANDEVDDDDDDDDDSEDDSKNNNNKKKKKLQTAERYYEKYGDFLDIYIYKIRMRVSIELFLFDCDRRGGEYKKTKVGNYRNNGAFVHFIGLGTGVWAMNSRLQDKLLIEIAADVIKETSFKNIDHVEFSYMNSDCLDGIFDKNDEDGGLSKVPTHMIKDYDKHKITINASKRNPADSIKTKRNIFDENDTNYAFDGRFWHCLLCAMYAWDGNSFPGNEYWENSLSASGDPAAAACSTIPYTQNSEINKEYINGKQTMVYFRKDKGKYEYQRLEDVVKSKDWQKKSIASIPYPQYRK